MKLSLAPVLALTLLLQACGGSGDQPGGQAGAAATPADTAQAFFEAAQRGDQAGFEALLTEAARAGLQAGGGGFSLDKGVGTFEIGQTELDGDEARVPVLAEMDGQSQDLKLCLRQENGAWRVWGFDVVIGTETAMTIDLESIGGMMEELGNEMAGAFQEAFEDAAMGGSEEEIQLARERFDTVAAISGEDHEKAWRVSFAANGQPAGQILAALLSDTNLTLDTETHASALARGVTFELSGVSRIEAFERVCAAADLAPIYPSGMSWENPDQITFNAGSRPRPTVYAGPFLIEIAELEEQAPNTTGSISIAVHALGLAPEVLAYQTEMVQLLAVDSILAADGSNVNADDGTQFFGTPTLEGAFLSARTSLDLRFLLQGVRELSVTGKVLLRFPVELQETAWSGRDTEPWQVGDLTITRTQWGESSNFELTGRSDFEGYEVRLAPVNAAGTPLGVQFVNSMAWGEKLQFGLQTSEAPSTIDMKICRVTEVAYSFTLPNIPLTQFAEQPAQLEPLSFPGAAPLSAEFVRFTEHGDFPKVELTLRNAANKDTLQAQATFVYVDQAGKELETFPHTLSGDYGFDGQEPLASAGAESLHETVAFFMPEGTDKILVRIDAVTFLDASEWTRPE